MMRPEGTVQLQRGRLASLAKAVWTYHSSEYLKGRV
jgi:hypothetical protein